LFFLQVEQHTRTQVLDVGGAFAQVVIVDAGEGTDVLLRHLRQCALRPVALLDQRYHFCPQRIVAQHVQVGVEQFALFRAQLALDLDLQVVDVFAHSFQTAVEEFDLGLDVLTHALRDGGKIGGRKHGDGLGNNHAGRAGHAIEIGIGGFPAQWCQPAQHAFRFSQRNHRGQLRRQRDHEGFVFCAEPAPLWLLHHQHAEHLRLMDHRHTKEGFVLFFAGFRNVVVTRMRIGVVEVHGFGALRHQADQAFLRRQADTPYRCRIQTLACHQHITADAAIKQVNRADAGYQRFLHAAHENIQRSAEIARAVHLGHDAVQGFQHGLFRLLILQARPLKYCFVFPAQAGIQ